MRTNVGVWVLSSVVLIGLSGCGGQSGGDFRTFDPKKDVAAEAEHGHVHEHDHGHGHGPHDGNLIELGEEEYHAEAIFNEDAHKIILYILGSDAKTSVPIEATALSLEMPGKDGPVTHDLTAVPQEGDGEGKSSRFEITSEALFDAFHDDPKTVGKFKVSIGGKEFDGAVTHVHE